jgi:L-lactate dehydrogenase complex protein LldG
MTDARVNVLAAIDRQLRIGGLPPGGSLEHPGPSLPRRLDGDLAARFESEATALAVTVHRVASDSDAASTVISLLEARGASRVLAWDPEWLNCPGLGGALTARGIALESCWLPSEFDARRARLAELDDVPVGLTGAVAGLADTGSIVVISGPGRGRMASLLPPMHIALLRRSQVLPSLTDFLAANPQAADEGSNLVVITGPSRTGDIEMTLSRGVHGPGVVHVVMIE